MGCTGSRNASINQQEEYHHDQIIFSPPTLAETNSPRNDSLSKPLPTPPKPPKRVTLEKPIPLDVSNVSNGKNSEIDNTDRKSTNTKKKQKSTVEAKISSILTAEVKGKYQKGEKVWYYKKLHPNTAFSSFLEAYDQREHTLLQLADIVTVHPEDFYTIQLLPSDNLSASVKQTDIGHLLPYHPSDERIFVTSNTQSKLSADDGDWIGLGSCLRSHCETTKIPFPGWLNAFAHMSEFEPSKYHLKAKLIQFITENEKICQSEVKPLPQWAYNKYLSLKQTVDYSTIKPSKPNNDKKQRKMQKKENK